MNRQRLLAWLLRLAGAVEIFAFLAVVMPQSWMEISHAWLGMGKSPDGPLLMFMIRQASYTYGIHGLSLWVLASDVERFRPLIVFNGVAFLVAAPVFFLIDLTSGMPLWWAVAIRYHVDYWVLCSCGSAAAMIVKLAANFPEEGFDEPNA